jgi:hypothetical protein
LSIGGKLIIKIMSALYVVKHFDVIKNVVPSIIPVWLHSSLNSFSLQKLKEALSHRIVVTIAASAHAAFQVVAFKECAPVVTGVLAVLIRVDGHCFFRISPPHSHQQCVEHELFTLIFIFQ